MSPTTEERDGPVAPVRTFLAFPGQGAQAVGMGHHAFERSPRARALFARADEVVGFALSTLCFGGPSEALLATHIQQPAILVCSLAMLAAWEDLAPCATADVAVLGGHSLGEYTALIYAGALSFEEGVRLAHLRGCLMQEAAERCPGGMVAVLGLDAAVLEEICAMVMAASPAGEEVVVANHNGPTQTVLAGTHAALEEATALARARGARRTVTLAVGGAFHSPLMEDAAAGLARALERADISAPRLPVVANTTARPLTTAGEVRAELARQITAPVRWTESVRGAEALGITRCVDSGPGETVAGLVRRITPHLETVSLERVLKEA